MTDYRADTPVINYGILIVLVAAIVAGLYGFMRGAGLLDPAMVVVFALWVSLAYIMGLRAKTQDEPWLPALMSWAMVAKLAGSWARYFVLFEFYGGSGDARRYHAFGLEIAETWRSLQVPDLNSVGYGGEGTQFTSWITGLVYAPHEPSSILGGFWLFSLLAFVGQFFLYLAFRRASDRTVWKRYAVLVFFWPTLLYWPSSIGKEALILLFLGVGSWAAACLYRRYQVFWLPVIALSVLVVSMVRVHVAALFAAGILVAVVFAKRARESSVTAGRILVLLIGVMAVIPLANELSDEFGFDFGSSLGTEDLDPVFSNVSDATSQGGSAVSGGVIDSPLDIPAGVLKVLFRPLPTEARNLPTLAASLEGTVLLVLVMWRLPTMIKNRRYIRRSPYLLFCVGYSALFIWGWSAIQNLGIMARQRSLVIPFILALIAALGWTLEPDDSTYERSQLAARN